MDRKLASEAEGIIAWAVRGCLEWQRHGLQMPAEVRAATDSYKAESDPLCDFFAECCVLADDRWTKTGVLRGCYEAFCTERGDKPVKGKAFAESLKERGHLRTKELRPWLARYRSPAGRRITDSQHPFGATILMDRELRRMSPHVACFG